MIKVLIADDQNLLVNSLKSIIEQDPEITVVGCAKNGMEALELCGSLSPDVVLMDIKMPECDGVIGTKMIKSAHSHIKILILTMMEDNEYINQALANGADGYLLKDVNPDELKLAIKNVNNGFGIMSNKAYEAVRQQLTNGKNEIQPLPSPIADLCLNDDEIKLIHLIAEGKSNKQIAKALFLSEGRVKNIITELLDKLNLKNRYELLSFVYKNNLIN